MLNFPALWLLLLSSVWIASANTVCHDGSFVPDAVLRVTQQNITQSCLPSKSNVLINGTSPGPELRLLEGQTYWIRVYNDMTDNNLTMVSTHFKLQLIALTSSALAWSGDGSLSIQRWHTAGKPVANSTMAFLRLRDQCPSRHGRNIFLPQSYWLPSGLCSRPPDRG